MSTRTLPARTTVRAARGPVAGSRAALYVRISSDPEGRRVGVMRQRQDGRKLIQDQQLTLVGVYEDNDRGASTLSHKPRPDYERLVIDIRAGKVDVIVAYSASRVTRDIDELNALIRLCRKYHVRTAYVASPTLDLTTADGKQMALLLGVIDQGESERTGERVTRAMMGRAVLGLDHGGARRYGFPCQCALGAPRVVRTWEDDGTADGKEIRRTHTHPSDEELEAERKVVRWLVREAANGAVLAAPKVELRALARKLRTDGVPAPRGGEWSTRTIKDMILRPRNAGLVEYQGAVKHDEDGRPVQRRDARTGEVETPLVPVDVWETACAVLTDPARGTWKGREPVSLLAGIGECYCGGRVSSGANDKYVGRSCAHFRRPRAVVDRAVNDFVLDYLTREQIRPRSAGGAVDNAEAIAKIRRQLDNLADLLADEVLERADYQRQCARKRAQLAELQRAEVAARTPDVLDGVTAQSWAGESLTRRRAVVARLCIVRIVPGSPGVEITPA